MRLCNRGTENKSSMGARGQMAAWLLLWGQVQCSGAERPVTDKVTGHTGLDYGVMIESEKSDEWTHQMQKHETNEIIVNTIFYYQSNESSYNHQCVASIEKILIQT